MSDVQMQELSVIDSGKGQIDIEVMSTCEHVGTVFYDGEEESEVFMSQECATSYANAFAAAPKMLAALKRVLDVVAVYGTGADVMIVEDAIAEAEGKT